MTHTSPPICDDNTINGWCETSLQHTQTQQSCCTIIISDFTIQSQRLHAMNIIFFPFLTTSQAMGHYLFHTIMASCCEWPILYTMLVTLLFFGHPSHHVRTLMTTLPVEADMPYPHFLFFWLGFPFCTSCPTWGAQNCNPTLDTMYPCIDYMEVECYAQLCLLCNHSHKSKTINMYITKTWVYQCLCLTKLDL